MEYGLPYQTSHSSQSQPLKLYIHSSPLGRESDMPQSMEMEYQEEK